MAFDYRSMEPWENHKFENHYPLPDVHGRRPMVNYREIIALLNTCYTILSMEILWRLDVYTNDIIGDYPSSFLK